MGAGNNYINLYSYTYFSGSYSMTNTYGYLNSIGQVGTGSGTNNYSARFLNRILTGEVNVVSSKRTYNLQVPTHTN